MSNLLTRTLSSMIFIPGLLFLIFQGGAYFDGLCIGLTLFLLYEWATLWYNHSQRTAIRIKDASFCAIGILYIALAMYKYWTLKDVMHRQLMTFYIVWSTDVGAYVFGRLFGKTQFAPIISPKKTWEGFWGGVLTCIIICSGVMYANLTESTLYIDASSYISNFFSGITVFSTLVFSVRFMFYSVAAHLGDLLESWAKRYLGVKDSSQLIPGHGGFLDRFDSFLAVCLAYYIKDTLHYWGIFF